MAIVVRNFGRPTAARTSWCWVVHTPTRKGWKNTKDGLGNWPQKNIKPPYPGASGDFMVRVLYGTEKVLHPKIIICCWPALSRRERLDQKSIFLYGDSEELKTENQETDKNTFLKNVFLIEKFAERADAKTFHCFAEEAHDLKSKNCYVKSTLKNCWPEWDSREKRDLHINPNLARDGIHYGSEHHRVFSEKLYNAFGSKLK
jgi:hypothetical protein